MKSISLKTGLIYILISLIILTAFTLAIYSQQVSLIIKNRELETHLLTEKVFIPIKTKLMNTLENNKSNSQAAVIKDIKSVLENTIKDEYIIFSEYGKILYQSSRNIQLTKKNLLDSASALANQKLLKQDYMLQYTNNQANLFIPIKISHVESVILLFKFKMQSLVNSILSLYRILVFLYGLVFVLQLIFCLFFYFTILKPIKIINIKSIAIKRGQLKSRIMTKRKDEIGQLNASFNFLAANIEKKYLKKAIPKKPNQKKTGR